MKLSDVAILCVAVLLMVAGGLLHYSMLGFAEDAYCYSGYHADPCTGRLTYPAIRCDEPMASSRCFTEPMATIWQWGPAALGLAAFAVSSYGINRMDARRGRE